MFATGLHYDLIYAALLSFAVTVLLLRKSLGWSLSLITAAIRTALPLLYFGYYFDGMWSILDDWTYYEQGQQILDAGINPFLVFFDGIAYEKLLIIVQSRHTLYSLWNSVAQLWFGDYYFSAVFLNLMATAFAARTLYHLVIDLGATRRYGKWLAVFFLLHWDMLAWVSFLNIKDLLVMTLTLSLIYAVMRLGNKGKRVRAILTIAFIGSLMLTLRYYIPVLLLSASLMWIALFLPGKAKFFLIPMVAIALYAFIPKSSAVHWDLLYFENTVSAFVRFILTPRPWGITEGYRFLVIPSLIHWIAAPAIFYGAVRIWKDSKQARLLVIYFAVLCCFYALVPELYGPRHRLQLLFITVLLQFHAIASLFSRKALFELSSPSASPTNPTFQKA